MSATPYATARAATALSGLALLSPLAGIAVEAALAWQFGASATVDAFRIGALLLLFGQQLFIYQILPHVIVPLFIEYRAHKGEKEAWHVVLSLGNILLVPTALLALLVFIHPEPVVELLGPGLVGEARETASLFIRWFLPTYALLVWSGVAAGVLYAHKIFWVPPTGQLIGNVILVAVILGLGRGLGATSLVLGVLLSSLIAATLYATKLFPLMRRSGAHFRFGLNAAHPGVRKTLKLALPLLGTILLLQWGAVIVNRTLSQLPSGNLALFGYAWKLGFLVSLVPLSLATVLFPRFAETHFSPSGAEFREACTRALRMALFIAIPLSCLLYVLRSPLVALLFQRGAFSAEAAETVAGLLGLLLLGAPASAASAHMAKMFYAVQDTRVPMYAQLGSAVLVTALAPVVAVRFGAEGLMLLVGATLAWLVAGGLFLVLCWRYRAFFLEEVLYFATSILLLSLASAWVGQQASALLEPVIGPPLLSLGLVTASGLAVGGGVFLAASLAWQLPEAVVCSSYLRWRGDAIVKRVQGAVRG